MAELTLRAYLKFIDELIEQQKLDEAIAHCRRILESYPKHLDTYRLLGKSYLEAKRYGDAADIFQRVLSAAPDDFVSHIGMAIVREDEGNLDSAIWHMERAFETNPANPAIQQELRRLIGNRDGVEPAKVRMTRGALARMYAHGELYSQAIAELRAALQEDHERPDLQVMLASMYLHTNQHLEAAEVGNGILEKLPYCLEANRIMASVLRANNKTEEASTYHRRLAAIDPYMAFVDDARLSPETVDASSVKLDRLDWSPGQPMPSTEPGKPSWAASLSVKLGDTDSGTLKTPSKPAWLEELGKSTQKATSDMKQESDSPPPFSPDESSEPSPPEADEVPSTEDAKASASQIPEWMSEAGWTESTGEVQEGPISFSDDELESLEAGVLPDNPSSSGDETSSDEDGELAPAEIPGWMQDIAPVNAPGEGAEGGSGLPDWLGDIAADINEVAPNPEEAVTPIADQPVMGADRETEKDVSQQGETDEDDESGSIPGWLGAQEPGATSTIITWLGDRETEELERKKIPFEEVEVEKEEPASTGEETAEEESEAAISEWFDGGQESKLEEPSSAQPAPEEIESSWLEDVADVATQEPEDVLPAHEAAMNAAQEAGEEPGLTPKEPRYEELPTAEAPGWLQDIAEPDSIELSSDDFSSAIMDNEEGGGFEAAPIESAEAPSWLKNMSQPEGDSDEIPRAAIRQEMQLGAESETPSPGEATPPEDDTFGWLSNLETKEDQTPVADTQEQEAGAAVDIEPAAPLESIQSEEEEVDWLMDIGEPETDRAQPSMEATSMQQSPDWLHDVDEPTTESTVEETPSLGKAPDWLDGIAEPDSMEFKISPAEEDAIDWLKEIATDELEHEPAPSEERPIEEQKLVDTGSLKAFADEVAAADTTDLKDDEVFDWLEDLAAKQTTTEGEEQPASQDLGSAGLSSTEAAAPPIVEERDIPEEPQQGLDWLEDLAAQRGLDVDVGIEPSTVPAAASEAIAPAELEQQAETPLSTAAEEPVQQGEAPAESIPPEPPVQQPEEPMVTAPAEPLQETEVPMEAAQGEAIDEAPVEDILADDRHEIEETTEWLDRMATQPLKLPEAGSEDEAPDWLLEVASSQPAPDAPTMISHAAPQADTVSDEILPTSEAAEPTPAGVESEEAAQPVRRPVYRDPDTDIEIEIPDWLRATPDEVPPPAPPAQEETAQAPAIESEIEAAAEIEAEVEQAAAPEEPQAEAIQEQPVAEEIPPTAPSEPEVMMPEFTVEVEELQISEVEEQLIPASEEPEMEVEAEAEAVPEPEPEPEMELAPEPEAELAPEPESVLEPELETETPPEPEPEPEPELEKEPQPEPKSEPEMELEPEPEPEPEAELELEPEPEPEPQPETKPEPARASKAKPKKLEPSEVLDLARQSFASDDIEQGITHYTELIKRKKELKAVIEDINIALDREPETPDLWQLLGDAYMKDDQLQEAIKAYQRGTEVA